MGLLTKIYTTVNNKILFNNEKLHPSVNEQKEYLKLLGEPSNVYDRSFFKYKCLSFYSYSKKEKVIINLLCFFAFVFIYIFYRFRGIRHNYAMNNYRANNLLLRKSTQRIPISDIFPDKLNQQYAGVVDYKGVSYSEIYITKKALEQFRNASRNHLFYFHYRVVLLIRLSQACFLLNTYNPACITTYVCEREFADPLLTYFYEMYGVQYHGFMHGDYLYSLEHAFLHYSKYWLWSDHYERLFKSLKCDFISEIYTPGKYQGIVKPRHHIEDYEYYATYYFGDETNESIVTIRDALVKLKKQGRSCKVRPHPRFSNVGLIKNLMANDIVVEDTSEVSIELSLECSYLSIALRSTVLSQAYYSGKKIVLDDISNPKAYQELKEKKYILFDKADALFSELLGKDDIENND